MGNVNAIGNKSQIKWLGDGNTEVTVEPHHQTLSWLILPRQPTMKGVCTKEKSHVNSKLNNPLPFSQIGWKVDARCLMHGPHAPPLLRRQEREKMKKPINMFLLNQYGPPFWRVLLQESIACERAGLASCFYVGNPVNQEDAAHLDRLEENGFFSRKKVKWHRQY